MMVEGIIIILMMHLEEVGSVKQRAIEEQSCGIWD